MTSKNTSCALLVAALASIASCGDTNNEPTIDAGTDAKAHAVSETCGEPPPIPNIAVTYRTENDGQIYAVIADADFQQLQYFMGINALWASCARDL